MRVVELSDHPAEMLDQVARQRQSAQRRAQDQPSLARASADRLDERQRAEIHRLILRDHAFHATGRDTRPRK
ncbi:MAG: hypothetical protein ACRDPY_05815 [Streptosporangiaceae bacterium]